MSAPLLALLLPAVLCSAARLVQEPEAAREAPASEGALNNDVFVPLSNEAAQALASGDQALVRAHAANTAGPAAEAERQLDLALDQWHAALTLGGPGASTWFDAPDGEPRLSEGVRAGIVRRLLALTAPERAHWTTRRAPAAELAWSVLHGAAPGAEASPGAARSQGVPPAERAPGLLEIVRLFPLTTCGARAALELGDLALEAGLAARARGWYACCALEAERIDDGPLRNAAAARTTALGAPRVTGDEAWQRARACDFADVFAWTDPARKTRPATSESVRWLRPGAAFLGAERVVVQTAGELLLLSLVASGELELAARLRPADFLGGYAPGEFDAPREPPGWPFLPLADELGLVLVVGRSGVDEPNALLALRLTLPPLPGLGLGLGAAQPAAQLAWAVVGSERIDAHGVRSIPELEELGDYEFEPGPVASGGLLLVQARQFDGQVRSFLLAFDRRDGSLAWKRQLAAGADRVATQRFALNSKRVAGQPLLALEVENAPLVFAGTHLGLGVLYDALLGEPLWSFKNRRRGEHDAGWNGDRPLLGPNPDGAPLVLWGPMDSDRLYTVVPRPLPAGSAGPGAVLAHSPEPLAEAQTLLGGDADEHLVLGRMGKRHTVSARRAGHDRIDALDLAQDEHFAGTGVTSPERAWVATDRALYLYDRTRELYLLDSDALPPAGGDTLGGDVLARGAHVLVLGSSALWSFRVR